MPKRNGELARPHPLGQTLGDFRRRFLAKHVDQMLQANLHRGMAETGGVDALKQSFGESLGDMAERGAALISLDQFVQGAIFQQLRRI